MPTYSDAIRFEEEAPPGVIRLIIAGKFYHAYNRSAWLFQCCIKEHKVIRKYVKALKCDIYYIGFPVKSLYSNIGEHSLEETALGFDVRLNNDEIPDESGYEQWKVNVRAAESSAGDFFSLPLAGADAEREVIRRLKEFPLERRSMVECAVFLSELRALLSNK